MSVTFQPGRKAPVPEKPRLSMSALVAAAPAPPASVDWYSAVGSWPMYLNDQEGDCTIATEAHTLQGASTYGNGATVTVTDDDVQVVYSRVSGYRPGHPETDVGAVMQDVYNDWRRTGLAGHRILAFGEVRVSDREEVKAAINVFGSVGLGLVVSEQMMSDFNSGRGWTRSGGRSLGGHAVPAVGYDEAGVWLVTWAKVIHMSWPVFEDVVEEAWAAILPEWLNADTQLSPLGEELYALGAELAALTGGENPFPSPDGPAPDPTPEPAPEPEPGPGPSGCLGQFIGELKTLIRKYGG
ncbi:hypothetical protein [Actinomadura opuntiae]|uniref:hypothetical protein n=1 Tax=Actinomadura sp. OS1-43 TaxID=604315 RepID=UPI00255ABA36|nr:hypothetical protein [Actinomadura sp. OS1-43]MDL4812830.1 hypothetical protein [Actinomadura sp. OS1-43]